MSLQGAVQDGGPLQRSVAKLTRTLTKSTGDIQLQDSQRIPFGLLYLIQMGSQWIFEMQKHNNHDTIFNRYNQMQ